MGNIVYDIHIFTNLSAALTAAIPTTVDIAVAIIPGKITEAGADEPNCEGMR